MQDYTSLQLADPVQLLADLYIEYRKVSNTTESFDEFYSWGEMLLADFNDIDKYRVDPEAVFINVKNFKNIESSFDFLTQEQKDTLHRFFTAFDLDKSTALKEEFLKIWEVLLPLHTRFKERLITKKIGYEGMVFQSALENIEKLQPDDYSFKYLFFAGFNAITPIEERVFEIFKNQGLASFFWDFDNYYVQNGEMEAGLFQRKYIKKFPPVELSLNNNQLIGKQINIVSAPTDHGQVYVCNQILDKINMGKPSETALVLSDEQLLLPVINSLPQKFTDVNITMGYPLVDSLSGNFLDTIINLHVNLRSTEAGGVSFYYKNIQSMLAHPFVQHICKTQADELLDRINKENLYHLQVSEFQKNEFFTLIFIEVKTAVDFYFYIENILEFVNVKIWESSDDFLMEREFLFQLIVNLKKLHVKLNENNLKLELTTYFQILRKTMRSVRVPFEGEPLTGMQIMGFLETRNLDFKNVIILSVNEGVIPGSGRTSSFIPFSLRKGFGLPTTDLNDAMYAYYFYRILQAAENVWLVYNSGSSGMSSGERSRLIYQLEYDANFKVNKEVFSQTIDVIAQKEISIEKEGEVWNRMQDFLQEESIKFLSPSALSVYLQCSLRFYFKSVVKIREADEVDEVVDARIFGNIFHKAAEKLYLPYLDKKILVTKNELEIKLKNDKILDRLILESFTEAFYGMDPKRSFQIEGKNQIIFNVIKKYLVQMIKKDQKYAPFSMVGLEKDVRFSFPIVVKGNKVNVKLGGQIDRVDKTDKGLRIIDYKTGADKLTFDYLADVYDPEKIKNTKAIFQTFLYSLMLSNDYPKETAIIPMVYQVKELFKTSVIFEISSKSCDAFQEGNFQNVKSEVYDYMQKLLEELFNDAIPFTQTIDLKNCEYCPYKTMCGR